MFNENENGVIKIMNQAGLRKQIFNFWVIINNC